MQPIIIIGAGRSGTNILRDTITTLPNLSTWPCDEINYIWRYGNAQHPTDELTPSQATKRTRQYIRQAFQNIARQEQVDYVVEKTCANSLRVPFVDTVLPEAMYIFIVRDGRDVVASAMKRWMASLDMPYILRKARYVPLADMPYYGLRYVSNRVYRLFSNEERLAFWGPRFTGMAEALATRSLAEVCALQWRACVQSSHAYLNGLPKERVYTIFYEEFVKQPAKVLYELGAFLEIPITEQWLQAATCAISTKSIGKWQADLSMAEKEKIMPILKETLAQYGYNNDTQYAETKNAY